MGRGRKGKGALKNSQGVLKKRPPPSSERRGLADGEKGRGCLDALPTDAASQLDVALLDGYTLGVDGTQVGVLEEGYQVGLGGLLEGQNSGGLETEVGHVLLGDLTNEALEGQATEQELSGTLVATDLAEGNGTGAEAVHLLYTTGGGGGLAGGHGGELLAGALATYLLASYLLSTSHIVFFCESGNDILHQNQGEMTARKEASSTETPKSQHLYAFPTHTPPTNFAVVILR